jgi:hypothetical protein
MSSQGARALAWAMTQKGKRYIWGGTGPDGYDCSGLTQAAWKYAGVTLPRRSQEQANAGTVVPLSQAQPGDLVTYSYPEGASNPAPGNHVALYVNPSTVFAASTTGTPIGLAPIDAAHVYRVIRPGSGVGGGGAVDVADSPAAGTPQGVTPVNDADMMQVAGYQDVLNLTPWGIPLNPLKLPGFLAGKGLSLAGEAGSSAIGAMMQAAISSLAPVLLTVTIAGSALGLIGLGLWRATQPARAKTEQVGGEVAQTAVQAAPLLL